MIPRRVRFALLLAFICHGLFILTARYRLSYDAYTHMLFADHYAKDWFSLWDTRWYTGFEVVSYPPLIHQLIAIFIPVIGFDSAYALILWSVTTLYPLGVYAFSRIFTGKTSSAYAALVSAVMLPIYVTGHIFGQLPFLAATLLAMFSAATLVQFLREGRFYNLILSVSIVATTMAAHHATVLVQPFLIFAITIFQLNKLNWKTTLSRLAFFLTFAIPASILVIWPFWQWGLHQQLQTPIDHLSRHNFFADPSSAIVFFFPFYLPIGVIIPFLFNKWPLKFIGLQIAFVILFILGLGGTTSLPQLLFGKSWEWLTYDRFAFWASLTLTPFFGILLIRFRKWIKTRPLTFLRNRFGLKLIPAPLQRILVTALIFSVFTCSAIGSWFTPLLFPVQPKPIDMQPIVSFLEAKDHYYWRYLTFGFGDQFAYLSLLTDKAATLDGSYHTARTIPELRNSGVGQIDTAFWAATGIPAIGPILQVSGQYGVRWGFVNRSEYIPQLKKDGWVFIKYLKNGIQVWENPQFTFKPPVIPPTNPFESFSWGFFPMISLAITLALGTINILPKTGEAFLRKLYTIITGLMPFCFVFWYYKTIFEFKHKQVYFSYSNALFFLGDGLALTAVILWLAVQSQKNSLPKLSPVLKLLFLLCVWMTLSTFWSIDWRTSLYISIHFWLIFLLILSLREWNESWNSVILGFCTGIVFEFSIGIIEFTTQSTKILEPLKLPWPGLIQATSQSASILNFANGDKFLRVYGTFPHPNILAGFSLIGIVSATSYILQRNKLNWLAAICLAMASSLIALTFSRSAWLGLIVFFLIILLKTKFLNTRRIWLAFLIVLTVIVLTLFPLNQLFLSRTTAFTNSTEKFSLNGRVWLAQQALDYIKEKPLTGIGLGSFVIELAEKSGEFNYVEPVHNIALLVFSELGVVGFTLLMAIIYIIAQDTIKTIKPKVIMFGAVLAGIGVISLFDHYFWSLAPGRMMAGLVFGSWLGQLENHDK